MIYSILLSLLLSLGFIASEAEFQNLSPEEVTNYEIIINDDDIH